MSLFMECIVLFLPNQALAISYLCFCWLQVDDGVVLPDKASLFLTAIEDAEYKDDKIECEPSHLFR